MATANTAQTMPRNIRCKALSYLRMELLVLLLHVTAWLYPWCSIGSVVWPCDYGFMALFPRCKLRQVTTGGLVGSLQFNCGEQGLRLVWKTSCISKSLQKATGITVTCTVIPDLASGFSAP